MQPCQTPLEYLNGFVLFWPCLIAQSKFLLLLLTNVLLGSPIHYNDFQRGPRT